MSLKGSTTTSSFIPWDRAVSLVWKLSRDKNYRMSALIATGIFTGLRISDILRLKWNDLIGNPILTLTEKKTKKERKIQLNPDFQKHIKNCYDTLEVKNADEYIFLSQKKQVYTTQRINIMLKEINERYNLNIEHFSSHSLRKTFGHQIVFSAKGKEEVMLIKLSQIFNHSNTEITRRYLGITQQQILDTYSLLSF